MRFVFQSELVDRLLLGPASNGRIVQDSPIRGDVLAAYALNPEKAQELLLTPYRSVAASTVASALAQNTRDAKQSPRISYLEGVVVARLTLDQMLLSTLTMARWWRKVRDRKLSQKSIREAIQRRVDRMYAEARGESERLLELNDPKEDRSRELATAAALLTFLGAIRLVNRTSKHDQKVNLTELSDLADFSENFVVTADRKRWPRYLQGVEGAL